MLGDLTQQSARGGSERSRWLISASGSAPGLALSSVPDHAPGSASGLPPRRCPRRPLRCCPPSAPSSAPSSARPGFVGTAPRQSGRAEATRVSCVWRSSSKSRTLADLALVSAPVSALPFVPDHAPGSASALPFAPLPAPTSALPSALHAVLRTVPRAVVASSADLSVKLGGLKHVGRAQSLPGRIEAATAGLRIAAAASEGGICRARLKREEEMRMARVQCLETSQRISASCLS